MNNRARVILRASLVLAIVIGSPAAFCATVTWDAGGGSGNWSNALNWSGDTLPTSSDDVVIDNTTSFDTVLLDQNATVKSITVGNGVTFQVQAGWVLTVDGPSVSTVDAGGILQLDGASPLGGSLTGNGDLTVSGVFHLYGNGTLSGSGALTINNGGDLQIGTAVVGWVMSLSRNTTNNSGGKITFLISSMGDTNLNATITNNGILELQSDRAIGGTGILDNNSGGVIKKTTSTGAAAINVAVNNTAGATIEVDSGTLQFGGGASIDASTTIDIASGKTLEVTGGVFLFNSGSVSMPGSGTFKVSAGTLRVPTSITMAIPNVTLQGAGSVIDGGGTLILSGTSSWTGGTMGSAAAPGGVTQINSGNTLNMSSGPPSLTQNRQLLNNGTVVYNNFSGAGALTMSAGSKITNNGAFTLVSSSVINNSPAGSALIENNGNLTIGGGTGILHPRFENNAGATMSFTGSGMNVDGGGLFAGALVLSSGATLNLFAGTYTVTSTATVTGAGTLFVGLATLDVGSGVNLTCPNLTLASGPITGAGTLHVSGTFNWTAGTMTGSGPRVLDSTSTSTISCASCQLNGAALQLQASATYSGSSFQLSNGASLTIDPGKTLSITNNGDFFSGVGGGSIVNNGTIWKKTATGTSTIGVPVTMSGTSTIDLDAGTLQFGGDTSVAAGATLDVAAGTTFEVNGGVFLFNSGAVSMPGSGTFKVSTGTLRVPTGINATVPNVTVTVGVIDGGGTLTLTGTSSWTCCAMGSAAVPGGITEISPGSTLNITSGGQSLSQGRELRNSGTVNFGGTTSMTLQGASKITNNAAFHLISDASINAFGSGSSIDNSGTFDKSAGSGTSFVIPTVNNAGTVSVTAGTLSLGGGGTQSGSFTVTAPATLSFSGGTYSTSGGSIGGTGTLTFNGATATLGVPVNVGQLGITSGTATLNANASANAFSMTGGTLGGSGTLTLNNGGTWFGGTMSGGGTTINPATKSLSIGAVTLSGRTLQNDGTLNVSGNVAGSGTIVNNGTLSAVGNRTISAPMNNSGQVTSSAILSLAGGGTHSGTFTASGAASVIDFSGGVHTISGPFAGTGKFRFSGGTAAVNGAWSGMAIQVAGGSVALNTSGTIPALNLSGGTLAGSGNVTVSGPSTWSGGTIGGSGSLTFDAAATVTMPGTSATTLTRPLVNNGTINYSAASSAMLIDGVSITNSGTFAIQSSQSILVTPGTPPFINNGTLKKSAGAGVMQFAAPLMNSGLVQAGAGTLSFSGTYAQSAGTTEVLPGATLQTATLSLNGGSLVGNGTIAGHVDNHAVVAPGASPGTLTINGDYVQASNGALNIQIGGTAPGTQYDQLLVSGNVTLGGTLNVTTINSFVPVPGNAFQVLTFGTRPGSTTFAVINGLDYGSGAAFVPTYGTNDLQLIAADVQADLVAIVSAPPSVANGSAFAYTVTIFNQGGSNATSVGFTATLPPNVTFNSASPAICSGAPNLVCTVGALANQSAAVVVLNVTANGAGAASFSVFAGGNESDPNSANNSASASPSITGAADLRLTVTGTSSTVAGSRAFYTIVVTNNGPDVANNVALSVSASPGLTFSGNSGACTGSFPCTIGSLSSGQSATINSAWDISSAATGSVQLTVNAASSTADPNSSNNSASATTLIGTCPAIVIGAPAELRSGASAEATATPVGGGAVYNWSISDGTIDSGDGTNTITFTAGAPGTTTLAVNVTGGGCTLSAIVPITVKPKQTCQGTATPEVPAAGTTTADAVVTFSWSNVDGASGYRLWLQQGDAPPQSLGRTLDASVTKIIPPGAHHWYVETLFDGCASHESAHVALTILPAQDCDTHGAPQLSAPANDASAASATVAFSWGAVPKAIEYELWLAPAGGTPTLIHAGSDTSYTATVPPGRLEWYVLAIFGGCAATESAHRTFTYTRPPQCASQNPLLIAPLEEERLTSPVSFEWRSVSGATSYELYVDGVLAATTTAPHASGISLPLDERRWRVRARLAEGCGALDSAESPFVVIAAPPSCTPLEPPLVTAPGQISSGVTARIQWTFVAGATDYVVQISSDPQFSPGATTASSVTARQLPFTFTNESSVPAARYIRVYAVDTKCVPQGKGPFSEVAVVNVLPRTATSGVALLTDPTDVPYALSIGAELAGLSFTAVPTEPWITVTPASGIVPPGGLTLHVFAHTADLPPGTSTGSVVITMAEGAGKVGAMRGVTPPPSSSPFSVSNSSGVTTSTKSTPPLDALTIPAVANVTNFIARFQSDVYVTNTSAKPIEYEINFTPSGLPGIKAGQKSKTTIPSGVTIALNDIVTTWFGGVTSSGTLEIRPPETSTSTSSTPASGLANRSTFASSRTFNVTAGGTFGQYVPAVPYANFVSKGGVISLQQIAQSDSFRTNLGLVEGSGDEVSLKVGIFDAAGTNQGEFAEKLNGGEHKQINEILKTHGIELDDGRIELEVTEGQGKVTAYASVIGSNINDPLLVPPATVGDAGNKKWVVPGVTELTGGSNNWHTDVRIFNSGKGPVDLTLVFYSGNGGTATTRTLSLLAGEVRKLDRVLPSFFGISQDAGGALHVSSADPARLVVTARTYNQTGKGTYGQFVPAVTPEETAAAGSRPLQILQVEESSKYHSNIGFAEVSGKAVTLEVSVFRYGRTEPVLIDGKIPEVTLAPNEFRQIDSYLLTLGLAEVYNARISVRVKEGEGRAMAYLSLIDRNSGDQTYMPGQ